MDPTITDLPDALLLQILSILASPSDFRALEKSCKRFREMMSADEIWKYCLVGFEPLTGCFRDEAFRPLLIERIRHWQATTESILYPAFIRKGEGSLSSTMFLSVLMEINREGKDDDLFCLRGDASSCLMEILENFLILQLKSAHELAVNRTPKGIYPSLSGSDLALQDRIRRNLSPHKQCLLWKISFPGYFSPGQQTEINMIVRRLAFRAGIAKMKNTVYRVVWGTLNGMIALLVRPGCVELTNRLWPEFLRDRKLRDVAVQEYLFNHPGATGPITWYKKVYLDEGQSPRDFEPNPVYEYSSQDRLSRLHTLIPRHISNAAKSLCIPSVVYGSDWHESEATGPTTDDTSSRMYYDPADFDDGDDEGEEPGETKINERKVKKSSDNEMEEYEHFNVEESIDDEMEGITNN